MNNCMNISTNFYNSLKLRRVGKNRHNNQQHETFIRGHMLVIDKSNEDDEYMDLIANPRSLKEQALFLAVVEPLDYLLLKWNLQVLPLTLMESLLCESVQQQELNVTAMLISDWPTPTLTMRNCLPIKFEKLTEPLPEQINRSSVLDGVIKGLMSRKKSCLLKTIDFRGFEEDRRLSIELCRIPALWLSVQSNADQPILSYLSRLIKLKQIDYLHRYFRKISTIYADVKEDYCAQYNSDTIEIIFDCHLIADEIAVGLSLAAMTPFKFSCAKLWISELQEIYLPLSNLIQIFDPLKITHFQLESNELQVSDKSDLRTSTLQWIRGLRNLNTISLPGCFTESNTNSVTNASTNHQDFNPLKCLNQSMIYLRYLQKLNLSRSCLRNKLRILLTGVSQPLSYLNLQDCSLQTDDLEFLVYSWRPLPLVQELNLSRNNMSCLPDRVIKALVGRTVLSGHLQYLSIAYCSIPSERICKCLRLIGNNIMSPLITPDRIFPPGPRIFKFDPRQLITKQPLCTTKSTPHDTLCHPVLRVLCIQNFTPPAPTELLHQLVYLAAQLPSLTKLQVLPDVLYAFPGAQFEDRTKCKQDLLDYCRNYVVQLGRFDLSVS